ncbi:MAG: hypothetical protein WAN65_10245 [Candidatus Sulfotelmatobacter sp.]
MGKQRVKPNYRRRVLRLPNLDHCKLAVLNSLGLSASRRVYEYAIDQFIAWYYSEPRLAFNRIVVGSLPDVLGIKMAGCKYHQPATLPSGASYAFNPTKITGAAGLLRHGRANISPARNNIPLLQ